MLVQEETWLRKDLVFVSWFFSVKVIGKRKSVSGWLESSKFGCLRRQNRICCELISSGVSGEGKPFSWPLLDVPCLLKHIGMPKQVLGADVKDIVPFLFLQW